MKKRTIVLIIIIIGVLALVKIVFLSPKQKQANGPQAGKQQAAVIRIAVVRKAELDNVITASGNVLANEEVILKPEVAGKIIKLAIKEGAEVKKGELLVKINDADLQAQYLKQAAVQKLNDEKEADLKSLLGIKGISQEEYDAALSNVHQSKADMAMTQAMIDKTEIHAPFDGVIGLRNVSEGNYVSQSDIIASIQQLNPVKIDFSIPEKYSNQVHINDTVLVTIEGTGKEYAGKVYAFDPKIDPATRSLKARALIDNAKREIFPGSFARVALVLRTNNSVTIPTMAVIPELRGQKAYVVKDGKAVSVPITIGIRTDTTVEVLSGLKAGDTVAVSGIMGLKPGVSVKIQQAKK